MARTLTSSLTTWKAGPAYLFVWLVESTALNVHWSTGPPSSTGGFTWSACLRAISEIELSVPLIAGLASVNTVTIQIIENVRADSLQGLFTTFGVLEGADITISLLAQGETYANRLKVFTGKIDHTAWTTGVNGGTGTILAVDTSLGSNPTLPRWEVSLDIFPNAAPEAIGQLLPILYGTPNFSGYVPTLYLDTATFWYVCAGHAIDSMATAFHTLAARGSIFGIAGQCTVNLTTASVALTLPLTQARFYPATTNARTISGTYGGANTANAIDGDWQTLTTITPSTVSADGEGYGALGVLRTFGATDQSLNTLDVTLANFKRSDPLAITSIASFIVNAYTTGSWEAIGGIASGGPYNWGTNARNIVLTFSGLAFGGAVAVEVIFMVHNEGGIGGADEAWTVGEIDMAGRYQAQTDLDPVFASGVGGYEDTDGHITGTAGLALSQVGAVLQSILETWMGLTVNSTSFTAAKALTNWNSTPTRFGFGLGAGWHHVSMQGADLLDALTYQMHGYLFPTGAGDWKLVRVGTTPSSQYSFTPTTMATVLVETSRMETVYHSVIVRYNWSVLSNEYQSSVYAIPTGSNHPDATIASQLTALCAASLTRYGMLPTLYIDAWGVSDTASAAHLLEQVVRQHVKQCFLVTWDAPFVGIHLEVGDGVTLTYPELPSAVSGTVFTILRVTIRPDVNSGIFPLQFQARSAPI